MLGSTDKTHDITMVARVAIGLLCSVQEETLFCELMVDSVAHILLRRDEIPPVRPRERWLSGCEILVPSPVIVPGDVHAVGRPLQCGLNSARARYNAGEIACLK